MTRREPAGKPAAAKIGRPTHARLLIPALVLASSLCAQSPFVCQANTGSPPLVRSEGTAELAGDIILSCTGGTPTAAGQPIPQANFTLFFNTNVTTSVLAGQFTEALLIVDEPSSPQNPTRPVLNCGNIGAPDSGPSGPGVCEIYSDGNPADTYNPVIASTPPATAGAYGYGRPNVFQGRLGSTLSPGQLNAITFSGVPIDPPGASQTRTFRFTNLRVNAALVGASANYLTPNSIQIQVSVSGSTAMSIIQPQQLVAYVLSDLMVGASCGTACRVRVTEGFQYAWKPKNISFLVGNGGVPGNAAESGGVPTFTYNGGTNYPPDVAQNVPGAIYYTESGFEWQNNTANGPPSPNPPPGTDSGFNVPVTTAPLSSAGYGGLNTGIDLAGVAVSGTRIAFEFSNIPQGGTVQVPPVLYLFSGSAYNGNPTQYQAGATGVMVLTAADSNGNGGFNAMADTTLTPRNNLAVYEILWANPFEREFTELPYTPIGAAASTNLQIAIGYAPFYSDSISQQATNSRPVPRFVASSNSCIGQTCSQSIAFAAIPNQILAAELVPVYAVASSGLAVSLNSLTPAVCSVDMDLMEVVLLGVGTCTIQATQPGNANYSAAAPVSQSFMVTLGTGIGTYFSVTVPSFAAAGVPFQFTVTARDVNYNIVTTFTDPIAFSSGDASASLPGNMTLTNGVGVFSATFATIGSQTITATDTLNSGITGTSAPITVLGCTNGGGNFNLPATTISSGSSCFQAGTSITATSGFVVNGTANVTFIAGSSITLGPGFDAKGTAGATFVAYVP